jgi:hypothetical protein
MTSGEQITNFVEDYGPTLGLLVGIILALTVIYKAWPLISNFVAIINALAELPKLHETVKDIKKEVKPNGGTSLRDAVDETRKELSGLSERFDKHVKTTDQRSS